MNIKKIITGHCRICFVNNRCSKPFSWLAGSFWRRRYTCWCSDYDLGLGNWLGDFLVEKKVTHSLASQFALSNGFDDRNRFSACFAFDILASLATASCSACDDFDKCLFSKSSNPGSSLCKRSLSPFAANLPSVGLQPNRYVRFRCVPRRQRR